MDGGRNEREAHDFVAIEYRSSIFNDAFAIEEGPIATAQGLKALVRC